jgi:hypothetical protein
MAQLKTGDVTAEEDPMLFYVDLQVLLRDSRIVEQFLADVLGEVVGSIAHCA